MEEELEEVMAVGKQQEKGGGLMWLLLLLLLAAAWRTSEAQRAVPAASVVSTASGFAPPTPISDGEL